MQLASASSAQEAALARLQAAENKGYGRGVRDGQAQGRAEADQQYALAISAARDEHKLEIERLDERHKRNDVEIRGAAYWRGKVIGGIVGLMVGALATVGIGYGTWGLNERSLTTGAAVASDAQERGLIIDSLHQNIEGSKR